MKKINRLPREKQKKLRKRLQLFTFEDEEGDEVAEPDPIPDENHFVQFDLDDKIIKALDDLGFYQPTAIQEKAIPLIFKGFDLVATAQTGSGKTAAFCLPIIHNLLNSDLGEHPQCLVLCPTRELAQQITSVMESVGKYTNLSSTTIYGGVSQEGQVKSLQEGVDILVATPGRLQDLINQGYITLGAIRYFVLDESDVMIDMDFVDEIKTFLDLTPKNRQVLLFSATESSQIEELASEILTDYKEISQKEDKVVVEHIDSTVFFVDQSDKVNLLVNMLQYQPMNKVLVFVKTRRRADDLQADLRKYNIDVLVMHSDKEQYQREKIFDAFKKGRIPIMIATDLVARGLDVDDISHVINYDMSPEPEIYVHRIGRTGRAGRDGTAYNYCNIKERRYLQRIEELIGYRLPEAEKYRFKTRVPIER